MFKIKQDKYFRCSAVVHSRKEFHLEVVPCGVLFGMMLWDLQDGAAHIQNIPREQKHFRIPGIKQFVFSFGPPRAMRIQ